MIGEDPRLTGEGGLLLSLLSALVDSSHNKERGDDIVLCLRLRVRSVAGESGTGGGVVGGGTLEVSHAQLAQWPGQELGVGVMSNSAMLVSRRRGGVLLSVAENMIRNGGENSHVDR